MRILVCGGRDYLDYLTLSNTLDKLVIDPKETVIIQGGATGADFLAKVFAYCYGWGGIHCLQFNADWKKYGKAAGAIRNQQMLGEGKPDLVVAFPGGVGTADMIARATKAGVEVLKIGQTKK